MPLGPPLLRLRSTLFLLGLCLFSAGLLCSLVQRHRRLHTLIHTRSLLSQIEGDLPSTGTLSQLQWQRQLASLAAGGPFDRSTSEAAAFAPQAASVEQLVKADRRSLIQAAQRLIKQAELEPALELDTSHFTTAAETGVAKMMSSRNVGLGGGITSSLRNLWSSYNRALLLRPLATKIATGVVGTIIGDGVAQYSGYRMALPSPNTAAGRSPKHHQPPPFQYDFARLARLLAWSALFATPMAHYWFQFLDTRIMPSAPTSMRAVAAKLLLDQGFMAPFGTSLFFMSMKVMEGQPDKAIPEVRSKLWPVMLANWTVWPLANAINFALIPPSQRILYVNVLAVAWSAFMSHMANKPAAPAAAAPHHAPAHAHVHSHKHGALAMHALEPASSGKMS